MSDVSHVNIELLSINIYHYCYDNKDDDNKKMRMMTMTMVTKMMLVMMMVMMMMITMKIMITKAAKDYCASRNLTG